MADDKAGKPASAGNVRELWKHLWKDSTLHEMRSGMGMGFIPVPDAFELEDLTIRAGSFANAGEGWNTFLFPEPFDGVPFVSAQCDGCGVEVKGAAPDRFLYKVTRATADATTTKTLYTGASSTYPLVYSYPQSNYKTSFDVLTGAEAGGTAPVADAVEVRWMAVEYGGDES